MSWPDPSTRIQNDYLASASFELQHRREFDRGETEKASGKRACDSLLPCSDFKENFHYTVIRKLRSRRQNKDTCEKIHVSPTTDTHTKKEKKKEAIKQRLP